MIIDVNWTHTSLVCSGGSRISSRRGRQLPRGAPTYDFAKFSQKLHEIERISTPGGGREGRAPLRSATGLSLMSHQYDQSLLDIVFFGREGLIHKNNFQ